MMNRKNIDYKILVEGSMTTSDIIADLEKSLNMKLYNMDGNNYRTEKDLTPSQIKELRENLYDVDGNIINIEY